MLAVRVAFDKVRSAVRSVKSYGKRGIPANGRPDQRPGSGAATEARSPLA